jgi:hypothetical protein
MHFVTRIAKLHRNRKIKTGRPSADAGNLQPLPSRSNDHASRVAAMMHQPTSNPRQLAAAATSACSESFRNPFDEAADFPKAGRSAHIFFHTSQGDGIRG